MGVPGFKHFFSHLAGIILCDERIFTYLCLHTSGPTSMWNCGDNLFKQRLPNIMYSSEYQCPNRGTLLITLPDPGLGMSGGISRAWSGVADWWPPCHCVDTRQLIAFIIVKHSVTGESSRGQQIILKGLKIFL